MSHWPEGGGARSYYAPQPELSTPQAFSLSPAAPVPLAAIDDDASSEDDDNQTVHEVGLVTTGQQHHHSENSFSESRQPRLWSPSTLQIHNHNIQQHNGPLSPSERFIDPPFFTTTGHNISATQRSTSLGDSDFNALHQPVTPPVRPSLINTPSHHPRLNTASSHSFARAEPAENPLDGSFPMLLPPSATVCYDEGQDESPDDNNNDDDISPRRSSDSNDDDDDDDEEMSPDGATTARPGEEPSRGARFNLVDEGHQNASGTSNSRHHSSMSGLPSSLMRKRNRRNRNAVNYGMVPFTKRLPTEVIRFVIDHYLPVHCHFRLRLVSRYFNSLVTSNCCLWMRRVPGYLVQLYTTTVSCHLLQMSLRASDSPNATQHQRSNGGVDPAQLANNLALAAEAQRHTVMQVKDAPNVYCFQGCAYRTWRSQRLSKTLRLLRRFHRQKVKYFGGVVGYELLFPPSAGAGTLLSIGITAVFFVCFAILIGKYLDFLLMPSTTLFVFLPLWAAMLSCIFAAHSFLSLSDAVGKLVAVLFGIAVCGSPLILYFMKWTNFPPGTLVQLQVQSWNNDFHLAALHEYKGPSQIAEKMIEAMEPHRGYSDQTTETSYLLFLLPVFIALLTWLASSILGASGAVATVRDTMKNYQLVDDACSDVQIVKKIRRRQPVVEQGNQNSPSNAAADDDEDDNDNNNRGSAGGSHPRRRRDDSGSDDDRGEELQERQGEDRAPSQWSRQAQADPNMDDARESVIATMHPRDLPTHGPQGEYSSYYYVLFATLPPIIIFLFLAGMISLALEHDNRTPSGWISRSYLAFDNIGNVTTVPPARPDGPIVPSLGSPSSSPPRTLVPLPHASGSQQHESNRVGEFSISDALPWVDGTPAKRPPSAETHNFTALFRVTVIEPTEVVVPQRSIRYESGVATLGCSRLNGVRWSLIMIAAAVLLFIVRLTVGLLSAWRKVARRIPVLTFVFAATAVAAVSAIVFILTIAVQYYEETITARSALTWKYTLDDLDPNAVPVNYDSKGLIITATCEHPIVISTASSALFILTILCLLLALMVNVTHHKDRYFEWKFVKYKSYFERQAAAFNERGAPTPNDGSQAGGAPGGGGDQQGALTHSNRGRYWRSVNDPPEGRRRAYELPVTPRR